MFVGQMFDSQILLAKRVFPNVYWLNICCPNAGRPNACQQIVFSTKSHRTITTARW